MQRIRLALWVSLLAVSGAWAAEQGSRAAATGQQVKDNATKPLVQTTCPVMGEPIKKDVVTDFEGGKVYFCCPGCIAKFNKTPSKYLPSLYKQIYPQGEQTHCPVTGQAVDPQVKTDFEGKTILFSDKDALAKFKADPAKYAEKLMPEAGLIARGAKAEDDLFLTVGGKEENAVQKRKALSPVAYKGSVYLLADAEAVKAFKADPAKYGKNLDTAMKARKASEQSKNAAAEGKESCKNGEKDCASGKACCKEGAAGGSSCCKKAAGAQP